MSAKILGVFPIPSISHQVVFRALTMELARRGHEVTVITPDPVDNLDLPANNYKQIDVHNVSYTMANNIFNFAAIGINSNSPKIVHPLYKDAMIKIFDAQLANYEVKSDINNSRQIFDMNLLESIVDSMSGMLSNIDVVGHPSHPVLYPDAFREKLELLGTSDEIQVLYDDLFIRYTDYYYRAITDAKKLFGEDTTPSHVLD